MSEVAVILIDRIDAGASTRKRPAYPDKVAALAASIKAGEGVGYDGLRHPVEVREGAEDGHYILISGLHRVIALKELGRESIAAVVLDVDAVRAELLELEENLVRSDLTALDRAIFVARFREMFEAEHGEVKAGRPVEDNGDNVSPFFEVAVGRLGMHEKSIKRALQIANGLRTRTVAQLRATGWDENQKALLELAGVPAEQQAVVLDRLLDPENPCQTMREAVTNKPAQPQVDVNELKFRASLKVFGTAKAVRRRFYAEALISDIDEMRASFEANGYRLEPINEVQG